VLVFPLSHKAARNTSECFFAEDKQRQKIWCIQRECLRAIKITIAISTQEIKGVTINTKAFFVVGVLNAPL